MARRTGCIVATVLLTCMVLAGCNTVEGLGKDLSKVGDTIEGAAKKSK
ncbi:MAG TPA: entericidin A/B family lipoprotein [Burkholderiales bacterium]|nr:entericidin A/B family lipoprotein [Burkholderiales bacterium]